MGNAEAGGFPDSGVGAQDPVQLIRRNLHAAAIDHFPDPADQRQIPLRVERPHIAGTVPAPQEGPLVRRVIPFIAVEDQIAPNEDFTLLSRGNDLSLIVDDGDIATHGKTHGPELAPAGRQRIAGDGPGFGDAQTLDNRGVKDSLDLVEILLPDAAEGDPQEAKLARRNQGAGFPGKLYDRLQEGEAAQKPRGFEGLDEVKERPAFETGLDDNAAAAGQAREIVLQSAQQEHRVEADTAVLPAEREGLLACRDLGGKGPVAQRNDLAPVRGAGGAQHHRAIVRFCGLRPGRRADARTLQVNRRLGAVTRPHHILNRQGQAGGGAAGGGLRPRRHQQAIDAPVVEFAGELVLGEGWIERYRGHTADHAEQNERQARIAGMDDGKSAAPAKTGAVQITAQPVHAGGQSAKGDGLSVVGQQRGFMGRFFRPGPDTVAHRHPVDRERTGRRPGMGRGGRRLSFVHRPPGF